MGGLQTERRAATWLAGYANCALPSPPTQLSLDFQRLSPRPYKSWDSLWVHLACHPPPSSRLSHVSWLSFGLINHFLRFATPSDNSIKVPSCSSIRSAEFWFALGSLESDKITLPKRMYRGATLSTIEPAEFGLSFGCQLTWTFPGLKSSKVSKSSLHSALSLWEWDYQTSQVDFRSIFNFLLARFVSSKFDHHSRTSLINTLEGSSKLLVHDLGTCRLAFNSRLQGFGTINREARRTGEVSSTPSDGYELKVKRF